MNIVLIILLHFLKKKLKFYLIILNLFKFLMNAS